MATDPCSSAAVTCVRCVMDTTDPQISFNDHGVCNHCVDFPRTWENLWLPNERGSLRLERLLDQVRRAGQKRPYDCAIGLSGGVDSSYVTLKAYEWGLRPLVVHVDTGWNTEEAVANIETLLNHCGFDLHTHVVDWCEMRDLQLSYLRSGVPNQDVPQDHAIFAALHDFCVRSGVRYVLSGGNVATEGIFPSAWHGDNRDLINLRAIQRRHGSVKLRKYPSCGVLKRLIWHPYVCRFTSIRPLDLMPYDRDAVVSRLRDACGWKPYGRKHGESRFTRLFQNHFLPTRFGFDKRRPHLSSMILSGQLTRSEALEQLRQPLYEPAELDRDIEYFCRKLSIEPSDYWDFIRAPLGSHSDYPTHDQLLRAGRLCKRIIERSSGFRFSRQAK